jgi:gamma-glutamyltranspeptidase/glutathione hydrolase
MVAHAKSNGALHALSDFAEHTVDWVQPLGIDYAATTVHEIPPNGQGIAALMALGILRAFDLQSLPPDSIASQHLQIEAMKLAFADAYRYVSDPRTMALAPSALLDPDYLASRARLIDPGQAPRKRATIDPERAQDFGPGDPPRGGTVYLCAADERGMLVSLIQSNYMGFGSGVVVPGTGISLQNRGAGFSLEPGHPNEIGGGKRSFPRSFPAFSRGRAPLAFA